MSYVAPAIMTLGRVSVKTLGCECLASDSTSGLKLPPELQD